MPSHITHLVFAEEAVRRCFGSNHPFLKELNALLAVGAQGPDLFYHNQRTMPTGIHYGVLLHRHGYAKFCRHMVDATLTAGTAFRSAEGAFITGYITHAVLDRHTHPFINYFAGWVDPGDQNTIRFRSMHPFFERIIDLYVLSRYRRVDVNSYNFHSRVFCGESLPERIRTLQQRGLEETYKRARHDEHLADRLRNAYADAIGYYRYSNSITPARLQEALRREETGDIGPRWLAILHPFALLPNVDYLNLAGSKWTDPCDDSVQYRTSFWDLYRNALDECLDLLPRLQQAWEGDAPYVGATESFEDSIGNGGLSDNSGRTTPCRKRHANPLPLPELINHLRQRIVDGDIPEAPPVIQATG